MTPSEYCRSRAPRQRTSSVYRPAGREDTARLRRFFTAAEAMKKSPGVRSDSVQLRASGVSRWASNRPRPIRQVARKPRRKEPV